MAYVYRHFIPQNTAPPGAKRIVVLDGNGNKVCAIPLGNLTPPAGVPLYRVGVGSDLHIYPHAAVAWMPEAKMDAALNTFKSSGCVRTFFAGDLTNTGFYRQRTLDDGSTELYLDEEQMEKYAEIGAAHGIPVEEIAGNHGSYYGQAVTNNMELWEKYTGKGVLAYTVEQGDDLFIMVGQPRDSWVMSDEDLQWIYDTLEANRNRRCFVFVHSHMDGDSGNPLNARDNSIFNYWGATKTTVFKAIMAHYKNTVLFHGHTHMMFESQQYDVDANYTEKNGFRSVHIPSLGAPRQLNADGTWTGRDTESQGYIMDVHAACIVLRGWDFVGDKPVPIGTYRIDTPLVDIPAGTFTDPTGTITV